MKSIIALMIILTSISSFAYNITEARKKSVFINRIMSNSKLKGYKIVDSENIDLTYKARSKSNLDTNTEFHSIKTELSKNGNLYELNCNNLVSKIALGDKEKDKYELIFSGCKLSSRLTKDSVNIYLKKSIWNKEQ